MAGNNGIFHLQSKTLKPGESRLLLISSAHAMGEEGEARLDSFSERIATEEAEEIYTAIRVMPLPVLRKLRLFLPEEGGVPETPHGKVKRHAPK